MCRVHLFFLPMTQVLFAAGIILLVEKLFLQFVAINFHQKALADRLTENLQGLKALDRLSNAQPGATKKLPYIKRGHKSPSVSVDLFGNPHRGRRPRPDSTDGSPVSSEKNWYSSTEASLKDSRPTQKQRRKRKAVTSVIVDQVCWVIFLLLLLISREGWRSHWSIGVEEFEVQSGGGDWEPPLRKAPGAEVVQCA